ncbi:hypothetical protein [Sphingomonas sp.]|uniref:hypothetical protein n=1 Tax=Sphingomonas sp. TaxID=28214 RepID=UPI0035AE10FB
MITPLEAGKPLATLDEMSATIALRRGDKPQVERTHTRRDADKKLMMKGVRIGGGQTPGDPYENRTRVFAVDTKFRLFSMQFAR